MVVNNVRNRFTAVDIDDMLCPDPVLHVSHTVDTLYSCGPCIFGASINTVMRRHPQSQFEVGDLDVWKTERDQLQQQHQHRYGGTGSTADDNNDNVAGNH